MKREDVKTKITGITDEQLDWLMAENGRDVTAEKSKATELKTQLDATQEKLKGFEGVDVDDLKSQIAKLQTDIKTQADGYAFDTALNDAIRDRKGRNLKAIRGMLDVDALRSSENRASDINTALEELYKSNAWAFEDAGGYPTSNDGGSAGVHYKGGKDGVEAAFMGKNPNLKV